MSAIEDAALREDLRGFAGTVHLHSRNDDRAQRTLLEAEANCARLAIEPPSAVLTLRMELAVFPLRGDALSAAKDDYVVQDTRGFGNGASFAAETVAALSFMRGEVNDLDVWSQRAIGRVSRATTDYRLCERRILDAAWLLVRGRIADAEESLEHAADLAEDQQLTTAQKRILLLRLYLAELHGWEAKARELRDDLALFERRLPVLHTTGLHALTGELETASLQDATYFGLGALLGGIERSLNFAPTATSSEIMRCLNGLLADGYVTAVDRPVLIQRLRALHLVRARRIRAAVAAFSEAVRFAEEREWWLEAALARIQLAEIAPLIGVPAPGIEAARRLLHENGLNAGPAALPAARAAAASAQRRPLLTEREQDILSLVRKGYTSKRIAEMLDIRAGTVDKHIKNIRAKFLPEGQRLGRHAIALLLGDGAALDASADD